MQEYNKQHFVGERALFMTHDAKIVDCLFDDGESPLKESGQLEILQTTFGWKYPLWYGKDIQVSDSRFLEGARAGIWYTDHSKFLHCEIIAPKCFRRCDDLTLEDVSFLDAKETLWSCSHVKLKDIKVAGGDYFAFHASHVEVDNLELQGNYIFDSCADVVVRNSRLKTKDAFWNCKKVYVENSYIEGEYFGWNSEDVTLVNCTILSHQGFCYMKNVRLINCKFISTDLSFEYCQNIDAEIITHVDSIKNPISGIIKVASVGEIIRDDPNLDHSQTTIIIG